MGEEEEPLASQSPIIQTRFPCKLDVETRAEVSERFDISHCSETVLKDMLTTNWQLQDIGGSLLKERGKGGAI